MWLEVLGWRAHLKSKSTFGQRIYERQEVTLLQKVCALSIADTLTFYMVPHKQMLRGLGLGMLITKGVYNEIQFSITEMRTVENSEFVTQ